MIPNKKTNIFLVILFIYSTLASLFLTISGILTTKSTGLIAFQLLFLPITAYFFIEASKYLRHKFKEKGGEITDFQVTPRRGETIFFIIIFLGLTAIGANNLVKGDSVELDTSPKTTVSPSPLIFPKTAPEQKLSDLKIVITDGSESINIRQKPTVYSDILKEAKDGEIYSFTKLESGWYEVKLDENNMGYVYSKYAQEIKKDTQP